MGLKKSDYKPSGYQNILQEQKNLQFSIEKQERIIKDFMLSAKYDEKDGKKKRSRSPYKKTKPTNQENKDLYKTPKRRDFERKYSDVLSHYSPYADRGVSS